MHTITQNSSIRKLSGIYKITNSITLDSYIGSSTTIGIRWATHIREVKSNTHDNAHLQRAVNKYGVQNFKFEILATCPNEYLFSLEQWFIDNLNPSYNIERNVKKYITWSKTDVQKKNSTTIVPDQINKVRYLAKSGSSIREISKNVNISTRSVCDIINAKGRFKDYTPIITGKLNKKLSTADKESIIKLYINEAHSYQSIADLYKVSKATIFYILKDIDITIKMQDHVSTLNTAIDAVRKQEVVKLLKGGKGNHKNSRRKKVYLYYINSYDLLTTFESQVEASKVLGISSSGISHNIKGLTKFMTLSGKSIIQGKVQFTDKIRVKAYDNSK